MPNPVDDFFFDLNGYLILENAVSPELVTRLNAAFDRLPNVEPGEWIGNAQRRDYTKETGYELHNCIEFDPAFEEMIDNPGWIHLVKHFAGEEQSYVEGLYIDECIASIRRSGGHHPVHSGGFQGAMRGAYGYKNGVFRCGQANIILALTDIDTMADGPTMLVPGSHKSNFPHPLAGDYSKGDRMDALPGAVPALMKKGSALLFVDGVMHGGSSRTAPGERRIVIFRYGPSWGRSRFGYTFSDELLSRLTPERRRILDPVPNIYPGERRIPTTAPNL
jgi:ectoine hydroxylase-related dioxygenase (phytanoyl-CoA dioxygenase family)